MRDLGLAVDFDGTLATEGKVDEPTIDALAASELSVPLAAMVGVGDAQNDYTLLHACGVGVAVANALPSLKELADLVTEGARGAGVIEIVDRLVRDDLAGVTPRPREEIGVVSHETDALRVD